jgi:hypothetical protein
MIRSKAAKPAAFNNRQMRRTARFKTSNAIPTGATRIVRGTTPNYQTTATP